MLIYFVLSLLMIVYKFIFLNKLFYNRKYYLLFAFCTMAIILGMRGGSVGEDTPHYSVELYKIFENIDLVTILKSPAGVEWSVWGEKIEPLFAMLYKVVQLFGGNGQVFIFVVAIITCALFARFIYVNIPQNIFFASIVFLCDSLFMASFNGIRQMLALAVILNSYDFMERKEYWKTAFIILIGFYIHSSAVIAVPLLFLHKVKDYKVGVIRTLTAAIVLTVSISHLSIVISKLIPKYASYLTNNYWDNSINGILVLWIVLIMICAYFFITKIKTKQEFFGIVGAILYICVEIIGLRIAAFSRIAYYFRVYLLFLFPCFLMRFKGKTKLIIYILLLALLLAEYFSYARVPSRQYVFFWEN